MRIAVATAAACLSLGAAQAASPEAEYFAARDKARATYAKTIGEDAGKAGKYEKTAMADLARRLNAIVGPVAVKGFAKTPKLNPPSLAADEPGADRIDGLAFPILPANPDGSQLIVTTKALFADWSKPRETGGGTTREKVPAALEDALRAELFYTWAVAEDSGFGRATEIEIEKPAGVDFTYAMLGRWSQEYGPSRVDRLEIALVKGQRILIADVPAAVKSGETPACKAIWEAAQAEEKKLNEADEKAAEKDPKLDEKVTAVTDKGTKDWLACEGKAAKGAASYDKLKRQAQELAARMAGG